ncbi:Hydroxyacid oxidase 1 [Blyttiomyces sp. JEL0837]|nr:Hydroxyacid oxidase 1 [Blyttiomyces sp. JEL0837]
MNSLKNYSASSSNPIKKLPEVYLDGGIRRGSDVAKALALGARAVFIGRPVLWGLAHDGGNGVLNVLDIFREELRVCMALLGCRKVEELGEGHLARGGVTGERAKL